MTSVGQPIGDDLRLVAARRRIDQTLVSRGSTHDRAEFAVLTERFPGEPCGSVITQCHAGVHLHRAALDVDLFFGATEVTRGIDPAGKDSVGTRILTPAVPCRDDVSIGIHVERDVGLSARRERIHPKLNTVVVATVHHEPIRIVAGEHQCARSHARHGGEA